MATAVSAMSYNPFPNQCEPDMESWLDLNNIAGSPTVPAGSSRVPVSNQPASALTSPTTTIMPLDHADDLQTPAKPSHEYDRFKQQTGLPSNSVPGLQGGQAAGVREFPNSGVDMSSWGTGLDFSDSGMDLEMTMQGSGLPAFFYPPGDASQSEDFVDPSAISSQDESAANVRFWPGMHQQQAAMAKAQAQAQQQRQQQILQQQQQQQHQQQQKQRLEQQARGHASRRSTSHQSTDTRTEETIARVVNQIRQSSQLATQHALPSGTAVLPHVIKMKKDEEDMDDDERLLASEEGKKLSSKERRQLRNKVSARAFRSRRKEYISQLEGEVAMKNNECNDLRIQNQALMEENARSRAFIEKLLRHSAFTPFLEDLSRDEAITSKMPMVSAAPPLAATPAAPVKEMNHFASQQNLQIGMALVPETPVDLSMLSLSNNWSIPSSNAGFNFQQPQVFAVTEVPAGPASPLDVDALSGKGYESVMDETAPADEEIKHDVPVVQRPRQEESNVAAKPAQSEEDQAFDQDPAFALFHSTAPTAPTAAATAAPAPEDSEEAAQALMERFERMVAKMDRVCDRVASMTSSFEG